MDEVPDQSIETAPIGPQQSLLSRAVAGAAIGAFVNAGIWATVTIVFKLEIGILATLAGICTGVGVALLTRGAQGTVFQAIAVVGALVSILMGKYLSYWFLLRQSIIDQLGPSAAANAQPWSPGVFSSFASHASEVLSGGEVIWILLAVPAAWKCCDLAGRDVERRARVARERRNPAMW
jgi:hypothetical protein